MSVKAAALVKRKLEKVGVKVFLSDRASDNRMTANWSCGRVEKLSPQAKLSRRDWRPAFEPVYGLDSAQRQGLGGSGCLISLEGNEVKDLLDRSLLHPFDE
jgi:hypothetical protein